MENLKLVVNEDAALNSLLYYASKSVQVKKTRQTSKFLFAGIIVGLSLLFLKFNSVMSVALLLLGTIVFAIFPRYLKWYYKKHFTKTIKSDEYKNLIGLENIIIFNDNDIEIKNSKSEHKYLHHNFEYISETANNFFVKLKTAGMLTFPKNQLNNIHELKAYFKHMCSQLQIAYIDDNNWTWK